MITRVRKYIRDNRMLKAEDMVVAGVSGGADSIAMLHILKSLQKEIGFSMEVVHVQHGIRGQEADRLHRQGFRGKYRSRARMIFPRNLQGPTLQVETGGSATFAPELE